MPGSDEQWRGVYTIPVTPFDESGALDRESLRRCVEFCVEAGAHGIVMPVNASEFFTLSDAERDEVVRLGVKAADGAAPVIAGVSGVSPEHAVERAKAAEEAGADGLIALPPARVAGGENIEEYYRVLGEALSVPLFIQNHNPPAGVPIPVDVMVRLLKEVPMIQYLKEETLPPGHVFTAVLEQAGDACRGIMGGMGGRFLVDEYRRGGCGTMPGCHITDAHVALWDALERGRTPDRQTVSEEARDIFEMMLPALNFEFLYGVAAYKTVLHRRGVISTPTMRIPARRKLDSYDHEELDAILDRMADLLTWDA